MNQTSSFDALRALTRAASLRCPHCGARWRQTRWITLAPSCDTCRLRIDRGENDYFLGSYTINLFAALLGAVGMALAAARWPGQSLLIYALILPVLTGVAIGLYPISRLVWLAIDLVMRPARPADFAEKAAESH